MSINPDTAGTGRYVIKYDPDKTTFRYYDKKMLILAADLDYWEYVLTKYKPWEEADANGDLVHTAAEVSKMKKADGLARKAYIMGNGNATAPYMNGETAYDIRTALINRFAPRDGYGLAQLHQSYNDVISTLPNG